MQYSFFPEEGYVITVMGSRKLKTEYDGYLAPTLKKKVSPFTIAKERIGERELKRRLWHMTPGFMPFVAWGILDGRHLSSSNRVKAVLAFALVFGALISTQFAQIGRKEETGFIYKVWGYATPVLVLTLLFPTHFELGFTVLAILAFGDGSATLAGLYFRGPRLPWNSKKTVAGIFGFFIMGGSIATLLFWHHSTPHAPILLSLLCAGFATMVGAFAESLPLRGNDNFRVGVCSAIAVLAVRTLIWGWP